MDAALASAPVLKKGLSPEGFQSFWRPGAPQQVSHTWVSWLHLEFQGLGAGIEGDSLYSYLPELTRIQDLIFRQFKFVCAARFRSQ